MAVFSLPKKILFSAIATVLFFVLLEIILRLAGFSYDPSESMKVHGQIVRTDFQGIHPDPSLPWSWLPIPRIQRTIYLPIQGHSFTMSFNDKGFRGANFSEHKPAGIVRIVSMGDSCTLGWGVNDDKTYCARLQESLNRKSDKKIEIINAGVLGFTSFQGLHDLKTRILDLQPDLVLLSYNWNDHLPALKVTSGIGSGTNERHIADKDLPKKNFPSAIANELMRFRVFQFLDYTIVKTAPSISNQQLVESKHELFPRVALPDFKQNLREIIEMLRAHKSKVILFTESSQAANALTRDLNAEDLPYIPLQSHYNDAIKEVASQLEIPCVDTVTELSQYPDSEIYLDIVHKTPKGNSLIANQLAPVALALVSELDSDSNVQ